METWGLIALLNFYVQLKNGRELEEFVIFNCKICELNTERESVFVADVSGVAWKSAAKIFTTISGSQMGSQL